MQQKEIKYTGITTIPSDYDCPDGDIASMMNFVNENGNLSPVTPPEVLFTLGDNQKVLYIHKTATYTNYIFEDATSENKKIGFFPENSPNNVEYILSLDFDINNLTSIGNILCILTDKNIKYALWNGKQYSLFDTSLFKYNISLECNGCAYTHVGEGIGEAWPKENRITAIEARNLFVAADALINNKLSLGEKTLFKYMSFGVAALKLYDGSYISISNIFIIAPKGGMEVNARIDFYNPSNHVISFNFEQYKVKIKAEMDVTGIEDLIYSIDIFLAAPTTLFDIDKEYNGGKSMKFETKSNEKLYEEIDGLVFRKSISIEKRDFGKEVYLERIIDAGESISLADFKRSSWGAKHAFSYNNRLNLANVRKTHLPLFDIAISTNFHNINTEGGYFNAGQDDMKYWVPYVEVEPYGNLYGQYLDIYKGEHYDWESSRIKERSVEVVIIVYIKIDHFDKISRYTANIQYPLSPIFMFPNANAYKADIYLCDKERKLYKKKTFTLCKSKAHDMACYINTNAFGLLSMIQYMDVTINIDGEYGNSSNTQGNIYYKENESWANSTSEEFNLYKNMKDFDSDFTGSQIICSEINNPFVFPTTGSNIVGTGEILGIRSATKALSQGQFGQFPLYAFTDEGIWALEVSAEGKFIAKQPATRDSCNNPNSITQIDTAVLFTSERGIMHIQGSESVCISEVLNEKSFDISTLKGYDQLIQMTDLTVEHFKHSNFIEYIKGCAMSYDYTNQRIIVFNKEYSYAYVFSLQSKTWGMIPSDFTNSVNSYPDSYIMTKSNTLVNLSSTGNGNAKEVKGIIITRPLKLDSPDLLKTITQSMHRGIFRKGKVKTVLFGSRDCINFVPIASSLDHTLRSVHGSPYKYFRFAIIAELSPGESISGTSIIYETRQTNKLR